MTNLSDLTQHGDWRVAFYEVMRNAELACDVASQYPQADGAERSLLIAASRLVRQAMMWADARENCRQKWMDVMEADTAALREANAARVRQQVTELPI